MKNILIVALLVLGMVSPLIGAEAGQSSANGQAEGSGELNEQNSLTDILYKPRKADKVLRGFPQDNLTIPVKDITSAIVKVENKGVAIDGYWEFKDQAGQVLREPIILSQPADLTDRLVLALRAVGTAFVEITEDGVTTVYQINVIARFKENSIEKELEAAIVEFVGDPGLKVKILPPQAALVGANLSRSFGTETSNEILAPRGETTSSATGQIVTAQDFRPTIVLMGEVENELIADKAIEISASYSPNVVNLMSIRNYLQVKMRVKVIKVDVTEQSNIGLQHRSALVTVPGGAFGFGLGFQSSAPFFETGNNGDLPIFGANLPANINTTVNLGKINGKATLLQEPTLTVLNGQAAEFNVGTLIPQVRTVVTDLTATTTTEFIQTGVILRISPIIDRGATEEPFFRPSVDSGGVPISVVSRGRDIAPRANDGTPSSIPSRREVIRTIDENGVLKMMVQPSIITPTVGGALDTNFIESRVAMRSGQSLVMGGLFTDSMIKNLESIPFVEKIPIIGELFKNRTNDKRKSELIFVLQPEILGLKSYDKWSAANDTPRFEEEINNMNVRTPDLEKRLVDEGARRPASKPVRISAANVTPRKVSIIEPTPADFPPIQLNESSPQAPAQGEVVNLRTEEEAPAPAEASQPVIETAPEASKPQ
ncbi:MAG: type II and III secretion system protein [Blastochloris sp.]|nr:type II and III secretion system protein [Blastochloris sp.]